MEELLFSFSGKRERERNKKKDCPKTRLPEGAKRNEKKLVDLDKKKAIERRKPNQYR